MALITDALIRALRDLSEGRAAKLDASSAEWLNAAGREGTARLVDLRATVGAGDREIVVRAFAGPLERQFSRPLREGITRATADQLAFVKERIEVADALGLSRKVADAARLAVDWIDVVPEKLGGYTAELLRGGVLAPIRTVELTDLLRVKLSGDLKQYAGTSIRTSLEVMDQVVINESAKGLGLEFLIYTGPDDVIARPFCGHLVNTAFPAEAFRQADNGQLPGVEITRGGYNCRHRLRPIGREELVSLKGIAWSDAYRMVVEVVAEATKDRPARTITYPVAA